jgi:hypothetical protein
MLSRSDIHDAPNRRSGRDRVVYVTERSGRDNFAMVAEACLLKLHVGH